MESLHLAVNLTGWRTFVRRREDKAFLPVMKQVLLRDKYTCQYCAFQAQQYQEVVNKDGNYAHNNLDNLITACCFCVQCLFLQSVGMDDMSGGQLIYLPEISQADLNSLCHILFCAMSNSTGYQESAQNIYRSFKFRSQVIENNLGSGTSNPNLMGQMIIEHNARSKVKATHLLKEMRLLPSNVKFKVQLDAWANAALKELELEESAAVS